MFVAVIFGFTVQVGEVSATSRSVTSPSGPLPVLNYHWNNAPIYTTDTVPLSTTPSCTRGTCGWIQGLNAGALATITYKAQLIDADTGNAIDNLSSVPVGTRFRVLRDTSTLGTDIWWVGTGVSFDSPYGRWVTNAGPLSVACNSADFLNRAGFAPYYDVYILFNVNPPTTAVTGTSANLSCVGNVCTVTGQGPVTVGLNFSATQGKLYYRYDAFLNNIGCHANNVPMRVGPFVDPLEPDGGTLYAASFPAKTITFSLTAEAVNAAPSAPTITGPVTGEVSDSYTFGFQATDPDDDTVRYEIDWDNNGSVDQLLPLDGSYVSSGTALSAPYSWTTEGSKTFRARTRDNRGASSGWAYHTITITVSPDLTAAVPTVSPALGISVGQPISFTSSITNTGSGAITGSFPNIFRVNGSTLVSGSNILNLLAGASANTTASFTPTSSGVHTVSACADNNTSWVGNITESDEGNNCSTDATFTAIACTTSLTASPSTIEQGESATLSWSPSSSFCGFTNCTFTDGPSYSGASGTRTVSPNVTSTYGISCIGPYNPSPGTPPDYETITVLVPEVSIDATPDRVRRGGQVTVEWDATNVSSCTITRNGVAWRGPLSGGDDSSVSGSAEDTITGQTSYVISCENNAGLAPTTASKVVNVLGNFQEF